MSIVIRRLTKAIPKPLTLGILRGSAIAEFIQ